jgi:hypothetical protein
MRCRITLLAIAVMSVACVAQQATTARHPVSVPRVIIAVTPEQKRMLAAVTNLPFRATQAQVQQILGSPTEANPSRWFYNLPENRNEGGYFITVDVNFVSNRLDTVEIATGHDETLSPARTE